MEARKQLICDPLGSPFLSYRLKMYADALNTLSGALSDCVGFIDVTNINDARPGLNKMQCVAYSWHKRKHSIKFQGVNAPDGLFIHISVPLEGLRNYWALCVAIVLDEKLDTALVEKDYQIPFMDTLATVLF